MRTAARWLAALLTMASGLAPSMAAAAVVERVIAVVGDKAILLSELHDRAKPFERQIEASGMPASARQTALGQLYHDLAERLVDEELQDRAAARSNITVTADEVDRASERLAAQNGISVLELFEEAERSGISRSQYRQEVRRQLLEARMLNLRMQGRVRISEDDMRAAYKQLAMEERRSLGFQMAWIRIPISPGEGGSEQARKLAEQVSQRAKAGADFAALARRYSSDLNTSDSGGVLPPMTAGELQPEIGMALSALEPGDISAPLKAGEAWVVLRLLNRDESQMPAYDEAKPQLQQRVYADKMERAKRQWLRTLRRRTHVDVRL